MTDRQLLELLIDKLAQITEDVGNIKGQVRENTDMIKAILQQNETQKIQMGAVTNSVARVEGEIKNLRSDVSTIEMVTAKNWTDIVNLKTIK